MGNHTLHGVEPCTAFPALLTAGDSLAVDVALPQVTPGDTVRWTLVDAAGSATTIDATPSGGETYRITVPTSTSASFATGPAQWVITIHGDQTRRSVRRGDLEIGADGASASRALERRLHIDRVIQACEARLEGKVTDDVQMYQLPDGVTVSKLTLAEVRDLLREYQARRRRLASGGRLQVREAWYGGR